MSTVLDPGLLDVAAVRLGFDRTNLVQVLNLAAVAVTRLAWRDSPVEDWHATPCSRISDGEMMRANVATTRLVRGLLWRCLPIGDLVVGDAADDPGAAFAVVHGVLADPDRCLPDGRTLREVAPNPGQLARFDEHVQTLCDLWTERAIGLGLLDTLTVLACRGAVSCWRWWLAPSWPNVIGELIRRIEEPDLWCDQETADHVRRLARPTDVADVGELHRLLLAGPDQLSESAAVYCLRAGLGALLPQDCGLSPVTRRALPSGYLRMVDCPEARFFCPACLAAGRWVPPLAMEHCSCALA